MIRMSLNEYGDFNSPLEKARDVAKICIFTVLPFDKKLIVKNNQVAYLSLSHT